MSRAPDPRLAGLHVLADDAPHWKWSPLEIAHAACAGGASVLQLRAKRAGDREAVAWGREIREATRAAGVLFVVNDRFDLALVLEADGVHLGQRDLAPRRVPSALRARLVIGRSTHTPEQLESALAEPADYLAWGPVFESASKPAEYPPRGVQALAEAATRAAPRPLVAIGGIDARRVAALRRAGAAGFAVIGAVAASDDPEAAVRALARAWRETE